MNRIALLLLLLACSTSSSFADSGLSDDDYDVGPASHRDIDVNESELPGAELPGSGDAVMGGRSDSGRSTDGRAAGSLEDQFDVSLEVFDGIVLSGKDGARAMETAGAGQSSRGSQQGGSQGASGSSGSQGGASGSASGSSGSAGQQSRIPAPPSESQSSSSGSGGGQSAPGGSSTRGRSSGKGQASTAPEDIPDGDDDDLIARQIREAAENETDPELRDKLWEEYRKYKNGQR